MCNLFISLDVYLLLYSSLMILSNCFLHLRLDWTVVALSMMVSEKFWLWAFLISVHMIRVSLCSIRCHFTQVCGSYIIVHFTFLSSLCILLHPLDKFNLLKLFFYIMPVFFPLLIFWFPIRAFVSPILSTYLWKKYHCSAILFLRFASLLKSFKFSLIKVAYCNSASPPSTHVISILYTFVTPPPPLPPPFLFSFASVITIWGFRYPILYPLDFSKSLVTIQVKFRISASGILSEDRWDWGIQPLVIIM